MSRVECSIFLNDSCFLSQLSFGFHPFYHTLPFVLFVHFKFCLFGFCLIVDPVVQAHF